MKLIAENERVQKYLERHRKNEVYRWNKVSDPRKKQGRRWKKLGELLDAALMGLVSGCDSLRSVESIWNHLKQVWRVEQITQDKEGKTQTEERYFLSSLTQGRLSPEQILLVVRGHWRVENDCFWSLDMQWNEDSAPWCRTGRSTEILSWIRLMAYNLVQKLRRCTLRIKLPDGTRKSPPAWNDVFAWINQAWHITIEANTVRG